MALPNEKKPFVRRSVRNKIISIAAMLLSITVIVTMVAIYLANTLNMVTNISRGERAFTYNLLKAQISALNYVKTGDAKLRQEFEDHIKVSNSYAKIFGTLPQLIKKMPRAEVIALLDENFAEFDQHTSAVVADRVEWLGWLPQVKKLIDTAYAGHLALKKYKRITINVFDMPSDRRQNDLIEQWQESSAAVLGYSARFSLGAGELSSFVLNVAYVAQLGALLLLACVGGLVSFLIARSIIGPIKHETDRLLESVTTIASTATQSSATAFEQASSITEAAGTVEEIERMGAVATENAQAVLKASVESARQGKIGLASVKDAVDIMNTISEAKGVVDSVEDIAEQSNLLAINASIEASTAGSVGRGFAVVAKEIRNLATQSKVATQQIRVAINQTEDGRQAIESVHGIVAQLADSLEGNADQAKNISEAAVQQSAGLSQIKDAMQQIRTGSQYTTSVVQQLEDAATSISSIAKRLNQIITG